MSAIPAGPAKVSGSIVGLAAANGIIALRAGDGRMTPIGTSSSVRDRRTQARECGGSLRHRVRRYPWVCERDHVHAPQTPWDGSVQPFLLKKPGAVSTTAAASTDEPDVGAGIQRGQDLWPGRE